MAYKNVDGVLVEMTGNEYQSLVVTDIPLVPQTVAMSSFQLALLEIGELDNVQPVIDLLPMPDKRKAQILWDKANTVERNNPFIVSMGAAMGKTEQEIDDLFVLASTF